MAFVLRRWRWLIGATVVAIGALAIEGRHISVDNGLSMWFEDGDPVIAEWDSFREQFGNDELIVVGATDPVSVFSPPALERIRDAAVALEAHPKIRRVTSLANGSHVYGDVEAIRSEPLLPPGPVTDAGAESVRNRVAENPILRDVLASSSERMALLIVEPERVADMDAERATLVRAVRDLAGPALQRDGGEFHMSGMGVVYQGLDDAAAQDAVLFIGLSYLVLTAGLWIVCRRAVWVAAGWTVVSLATLLVVGLCGLAGRDLNLVTSVVPTLLMCIGILDLIHLLEAYEERRAEVPGRRIVGSISLVVVPCAFNTLTDILGFAALTGAPMNAIRDVGWLAACGLAGLFVILLVVAVPVLNRFGGKAPRGRGSERGGGLVLGALSRVNTIVQGHHRAVLVGTAGLLVVFAIGISRVRIDTTAIGLLPVDNPVRVDHDALEAELGPFVPYDFTVEAALRDSLKEPGLLDKIERLERRLEEDPRIGRVTGLPDIVKRLNQLVMDGDPDQQRIPSTRAAVAQELLLYELDEGNELERLADEELRVARITARGGMASVASVGGLIRDVEAMGEEILEGAATVRGAGFMSVYVHALDNVARAQVITFGLALVLITCALTTFLRSLRLGLVAMIPNLLPVAGTLAWMGYLGIFLDIGTVLIGAVVIGISVNDTTHLMFRFRSEIAARPGDPREALRRTLLGTGRAVVQSSLVLAAGFSVLSFAQIESISNFGLLCTLATLLALAADLVVTPAALLALYGSAQAEVEKETASVKPSLLRAG